jgi:hypothetical protein
MFAARFFGERYFAPRYFGKAGADVAGVYFGARFFGDRFFSPAYFTRPHTISGGGRIFYVFGGDVVR